MRTNYTEIELDALRELANIGAGNAATSLSGLLGRSIDVAVPNACALPLADALGAVAAGLEEVVIDGRLVMAAGTGCSGLRIGRATGCSPRLTVDWTIRRR